MMTALPWLASSRIRAMISRLAADVDARGRLVEHDHARLGRQPFGDDDLLRVAAGQRPDRAVGGRGLDPQALDLRLGQLLGLVRHDPGVAAELIQDRQADVARHAMLGHEPLAAAVFRDEGDAGRDRVARVADLHWLAGDPDLAAGQRIDPAQHARQSAAAAAQQAGHAHHLAAMHDQIDIARLARPRDAAQLDQRLAQRHVPALDILEPARCAADDLLDHRLQRELGERCRHHMPAVAQDRRHVRDLEDLVHAVRDVDDGDTLGLEPGQEVEQMADLDSRQRRAGLVENQDPRLLRGRLDDLGQLLLAGAQLGDAQLGIDLDAQLAKQLARPALGRAVVDHAETVTRLAGQEDVLGDAQRRHQTHLLEDHRDAGPACRFGAVLGQRRAVDLDRAFVGHVHAVQDLEDGRLAGAVAAEQRVDLALGDAQIDALQRAHAAERLHHAGHPHRVGRCGRAGAGHHVRHCAHPQVKAAAVRDGRERAAPGRLDSVSSCSWRSWPSAGRGRRSARS